MAWSITCRYASLSELPIDAPHAAERWLSPAERSAWSALGDRARRITWLAGRILAKQTLRTCELTTAAPAEIHIESRSTSAGHGERPTVFVAGQRIPCGLSIAHTERGVLVAVAADPLVTVGVDLVCDTPADRDSLRWSFTPGERRWLADGAQAPRGAGRLWAMKEALYKACQSGEGFAPRQIEAVPGGVARYPALGSNGTLRSLQSWRIDGHHAALAIVHRGEVIEEVAHAARERRLAVA